MFIPTKGPARERLDERAVERLKTTGTVITDDRRRRPYYFDGRFLAARDLVREQTYFLNRQADLGRAGGAGVVHGLMVSRGDSATSIRISPGHGLTTSGEIVVLAQPLSIQLADMAEIQKLDAAFGLIETPREPARNRSGLFIVALRPVEFTANPIASYPTSISGQRTVEDGDIVEGVAVTLIPFADEGAREELDNKRSRVARRIFVERGSRGVPAVALPIAMVALNRGLIQWVDSYMVRREVGLEHSQILGLGFTPRALREAHLLQYEQHLREVLNERRARNLGQRFAASEHFFALPPAGRMPAAAINTQDWTQSFFPPETEVDLSLIAEDEVAALLEDSLLLPPIDLMAGGDALESTSVLVVVPLPRHRLHALKEKLDALPRTLRSAAQGLVSKRKPLESLMGLKLARTVDTVTLAASGTAADAAWAEALAGAELLWYVRRRNLQLTGEQDVDNVRAVGDDVREEKALNDRMKSFGLHNQFARLQTRASSEARAEMVNLLSSAKFAQSKNLAEGALTELDREEELSRASVHEVAVRFSDPKFGQGLLRLEEAHPKVKDDPKLLQKLAKLGELHEVDAELRQLDADELAEVARTVTGETHRASKKPGRAATKTRRRAAAKGTAATKEKTSAKKTRRRSSGKKKAKDTE